MQKTETHVKFISTDKDKVNTFLGDMLRKHKLHAISPILPCKKLMGDKQKKAWKVEVKYKILEND